METSLLRIPGNACGAPEVFFVRRGLIAASGAGASADLERRRRNFSAL